MRFWLMTAFVLVASLAYGGSPYVLYFSSPMVDPSTGGPAIATMLDNGGGPIQGWSYGVCSTATTDHVIDGATTAGLLSGAGPDFDQTSIYAEGWTSGVVISFLGLETLPTGIGYELAIATYLPVSESTPVDYCDTLGSPPVVTVVVSSGASQVPQQTGGNLDPSPPCYTYTAPTVELNPAGELLPFSISQDPLCSNEMTQGFTMAMAHDGAVVEVFSVAITGPLLALNGGAGPDFVSDEIFVDGWAMSVSYSGLGTETIDFLVPADVVQVEYHAAAGATEGDSTLVDCSDDLGQPPYANEVVVAGESKPVSCISGLITIGPNIPPFKRGDCNHDDLVDVSDGIWILNFLFQGGPMFDCEASCDANDDSQLDTADATYIVNYRFLSGPPLPPPFPDCGVGDADDQCAEYGGTCP